VERVFPSNTLKSSVRLGWWGCALLLCGTTVLSMVVVMVLGCMGRFYKVTGFEVLQCMRMLLGVIPEIVSYMKGVLLYNWSNESSTLFTINENFLLTTT
jgi:hypothetical protein